MNDPYSILGISRSATDEEIKKAYRALSRKYHPDANINNPNKEQAEEKFKEVQKAYDQIMHERQYGSSNTNDYSYGYGPFRGFYGQYQQANSSTG
ncbi:MAG: J domain-containing protein, partial [Lachnospiraceae bacterium]|nr:J domain-containing protein [Lachnospiraceae bacterium]